MHVYHMCRKLEMLTKHGCETCNGNSSCVLKRWERGGRILLQVGMAQSGRKGSKKLIVKTQQSYQLWHSTTCSTHVTGLSHTL